MIEREQIHLFEEDPENAELCLKCKAQRICIRHYHDFKRGYGEIPNGSRTRCICLFSFGHPVHKWFTRESNRV